MNGPELSETEMVPGSVPGPGLVNLLLPVSFSRPCGAKLCIFLVLRWRKFRFWPWMLPFLLCTMTSVRCLLVRSGVCVIKPGNISTPSRKKRRKHRTTNWPFCMLKEQVQPDTKPRETCKYNLFLHFPRLRPLKEIDRAIWTWHHLAFGTSTKKRSNNRECG